MLRRAGNASMGGSQHLDPTSGAWSGSLQLAWPGAGRCAASNTSWPAFAEVLFLGVPPPVDTSTIYVEVGLDSEFRILHHASESNPVGWALGAAWPARTHGLRWFHRIHVFLERLTLSSALNGKSNLRAGVASLWFLQRPIQTGAG